MYRFSYHFTGVRQTNRLDKPEWFFTQILTWAKENHAFVASHFQLAANRAGRSDLNVRVSISNQLTKDKGLLFLPLLIY